MGLLTGSNFQGFVYACTPYPRMNSSHAMKSCVLILLVALLCAEKAQGLRCYQCLGIAPCEVLTCPSSDTVCVTQNVEAKVLSSRIKTKNKFCAPACPNNLGFPEYLEIMGTGSGFDISCCMEDLCNAAVPTAGRTWTLAGVLLFSLGSVLLQTLL